MPVELYRNFITTGAIAGYSSCVVQVPKERETCFREQFPESEVEKDGYSMLSFSQVENAARVLMGKVEEGEIDTTVVTSDIIQLNKARHAIEYALDSNPDGREFDFSPDVVEFLKTRDGWQLNDFETHWANKGIGGFQGVFFDRICRLRSCSATSGGHDDSNIKFFIRQGESFRAVHVSHTDITKLFNQVNGGKPSGANEYQYQRYLDRKNVLEKSCSCAGEKPLPPGSTPTPS